VQVVHQFNEMDTDLANGAPILRLNFSGCSLPARDLEITCSALTSAFSSPAFLHAPNAAHPAVTLNVGGVSIAGSHAPGLQLDLTRTSLRDPESFKQLLAFVRRSPFLVNLLVSGCGLSDANLDLIVRACMVHCNVETFDGSNNAAASAACAAVAAWLADPNCKLSRLSLDNNRIADSGGIVIGEGLATNASLRTLCLRRCAVGLRTAQSILRVLENGNASLLHVHIEYNTVQSAMLQSLEDYLKRNRQVGYTAITT
jgi:Ran GTPase-activating protein (RanGAP) involved in mRNA processing and transport